MQFSDGAVIGRGIIHVRSITPRLAKNELQALFDTTNTSQLQAKRRKAAALIRHARAYVIHFSAALFSFLFFSSSNP